MEETQCRGCDFSFPAHERKLQCVIVHDFIENLGNFCPKALDIETIKKSCRYYLSPEKTINGKIAMCSAHLLDGGHYPKGDMDARCSLPSSDWGHHPCWIENLKDLMRDPDFTVKEAAK